jgi:hypothetical protein
MRGRFLSAVQFSTYDLVTSFRTATAAFFGVALLVSLVGVASAVAKRAPIDHRSSMASLELPSRNYRIFVVGDHLALVSSTSDGSCVTRFVDPSSMTITGVDLHAACGGAFTFETVRNVSLEVEFTPAGDLIRARRIEPTTRKVTLGPVLMKIQEWSWAHSGLPVAGDGSIWVYGLGENRSELLEISASTGRLARRFDVNAGADPDLAVNRAGFWLVNNGVWGGAQCSPNCVVYHLAPRSDDLEIAFRAGSAIQWFTASGNSVFFDVMRREAPGYSQTIYRLDGDSSLPTFESRATLLPAPNFGGTGYVVIGSVRSGLYTLSELGSDARTPSAIGQCQTGNPVRVVRIDPANGTQSYVATLPASVLARDCNGGWLTQDQAVVYGNSMYLLTNDGEGSDFGPDTYSTLVRVPL